MTWLIESNKYFCTFLFIIVHFCAFIDYRSGMICHGEWFIWWRGTNIGFCKKLKLEKGILKEIRQIKD